MIGKDALHCRKCKYHGVAAGEVVCEYINLTDRPRGCAYGKKCIRFERSNVRRRPKTP